MQQLLDKKDDNGVQEEVCEMLGEALCLRNSAKIGDETLDECEQDSVRKTTKTSVHF